MSTIALSWKEVNMRPGGLLLTGAARTENGRHSPDGDLSVQSQRPLIDVKFEEQHCFDHYQEPERGWVSLQRSGG